MNADLCGDELFPYLQDIYGRELASVWIPRFQQLFLRYTGTIPTIDTKYSPLDIPCLDQHSTILITYGDSILPPEQESQGHPPLTALLQFLQSRIGDAISTIHILPFYPYSSDDGFSVIDPVAVDPSLGTWQDIEQIAASYHIMFDLVANHLSRSNQWIQRFLVDDPEFADFAITLTGKEDTREVFRPRTLPLHTRIETPSGPRWVWTTFSPDQIDLNYHNPQVLLYMVEVLLTYLTHGASIIRLDAVAFLWKEPGTSCLHHPKTHAIIRLFRWILDSYNPKNLLITETNVPYRENIAYFGNGHDEASLIYNFPLPPLVYHTMLTQNSEKLGSWIETLRLPSDSVTFFNFLASHDGIGVLPVKDLLDQQEIEALAVHTVRQGGFVSRKTNSDGTTSPYELNINYYSALSDIVPEETEAMHIDRFIAACAIMVALRGIAGIYIHSLIGSSNWYGYPHLESTPRRINREKINSAILERELNQPEHRRSQVLRKQLVLLRIRKSEPALSPMATQSVLHPGIASCLALLRTRCEDRGGRNYLLVIVNVSATNQHINLKALQKEAISSTGDIQMCVCGVWSDLLTSTYLETDTPIHLAPYQVLFLKPCGNMGPTGLLKGSE